jgi:L-ribulose-5-phosphate 3-epimerase
MKKGISIWAFPEEWPLERSFALAAEAGFDGIEMAYAIDGPIHPQVTAADLAELRNAASRAGLEISSMASGIFWSVNLISDDLQEREDAKQHLRRMLEIAADLEVSYILVVPCFAGPFEAGKPVIRDYEEAYQRAISDFQELAPVAERLNVAIGIENVWNKFLSSAMELRAFIDAVDSPQVGAYFDVANCLRTGYPEHWIRILGRRIKGIHFKDFRTNVGTLQGFVDLFEGDVEYPQVMAALKEVAYDGYCVVEVFARELYPEMVVLRAGADIQHVLSASG